MEGNGQSLIKGNIPALAWRDRVKPRILQDNRAEVLSQNFLYMEDVQLLCVLSDSYVAINTVLIITLGLN
jgi:hypothetical protein